MKLTLGQASKETGVSKATLSRALKSGKLSGEKQEDGSFRIDPAELFRVFQRNSTDNPVLQQSVTPIATHETDIKIVRIEAENTALKRENELLQKQIDDLRQDRDDWKKQAAVVQLVADMREKKGFWERLVSLPRK